METIKRTVIFSADMYEKLIIQAKKNDRSIAGEIRVILAAGLKEKHNGARNQRTHPRPDPLRLDR